MSKRIKLTIAYDGTNYVGWQVQKNGLAIEQVINEHLSLLLKENITVTGASRTDSGVHALGNVAAFDTETRIPASKLSLALNQRLPADIKIVRSEEVESDFHPRYADCTKTYEYTILNARYYLPTLRLYAGYVYYPLDVEKMKQAAQYLTGTHDFIAFSSSGGQQKTTVRTVYSIDISCEYLENGQNHAMDSHPAGMASCADRLPAGDNFYTDNTPAEEVQCTDNHPAGDVARGDDSPAGKIPCGEDSPATENSCADRPPAGGSPGMDYVPKIIKIRVSGNGFLYNMVRIMAGTLIKTGMGLYPPEHVKEILDSCDRSLSAPKVPACGLTLLRIEYK